MSNTLSLGRFYLWTHWGIDTRKVSSGSHERSCWRKWTEQSPASRGRPPGSIPSLQFQVSVQGQVGVRGPPWSPKIWFTCISGCRSDPTGAYTFIERSYEEDRSEVKSGSRLDKRELSPPARSPTPESTLDVSLQSLVRLIFDLTIMYGVKSQRK